METNILHCKILFLKNQIADLTIHNSVAQITNRACLGNSEFESRGCSTFFLPMPIFPHVFLEYVWGGCGVLRSLWEATAKRGRGKATGRGGNARARGRECTARSVSFHGEPGLVGRCGGVPEYIFGRSDPTNPASTHRHQPLTLRLRLRQTKSPIAGATYISRPTRP